MRKWFWCAALAALVGVGGVGSYVYLHPRSLVGEVVLQAGEYSLGVNPVIRLTHQVLASTSKKAVVCCPAKEAPLPEEPTGVEDPAPDGHVLAGAVDLSRALRIPDFGINADEGQAVMPNADNEQAIKTTSFVPAEEP